jgi:fused signal recognition particle receptor
MAAVPKQNIYTKLKLGLAKTKESWAVNLENIFLGFNRIDASFFNDLEDALIMADVGVETTQLLINQLKQVAKEKTITDPIQLKTVLIQEIGRILELANSRVLHFNDRNKVYLIVGVNGVGKTTTIAKLAAHFKDNGRQVLLVAGDTFRAAATEQLMLWGERLDIPVIHHREGADPAAVVFDGIAAANARNMDIVIIDTAGRLHTKVNLMEELKKVKRVIIQNLGERALETILVLDATTGQNAVNQTRVFHEALQVDGLVVTKLDGTARGGITLAIANQFKIPIYLVGVGETRGDLYQFEALAFTQALFE